MTAQHGNTFRITGGCFTNISRALQNILSEFEYCGNSTCYANIKLKLCTCAQSHALGTRTKFPLEILTMNVISGIAYFHEIILESSRNVSETTPWLFKNEVNSLVSSQRPATQSFDAALFLIRRFF